jgi:hypothetical protein
MVRVDALDPAKIGASTRSAGLLADVGLFWTAAIGLMPVVRAEASAHAKRPGCCLRSLPDQCQDTALRFFGQCQGTDGIGLCLAILGRPVGTYGDNVQWVVSGGHPSSRANSASTRSHSGVELFCGQPQASPRSPCG